MIAELAFINIKFMSSEFWTLLLLDFFMIVMRDADLWDELGEFLQKYVQAYKHAFSSLDDKYP